MKTINTSELTNGNHKVKKALVYCAGVKRRCRSANRHRFDLGFFDRSVTCIELKSLAEKCLHDNMKSIIGTPELSLINREIEIVEHMMIEKFSSDDVFNREKLAIPFEVTK